MNLETGSAVSIRYDYAAGDLFPGVELPPSDYGALIGELEHSATTLGLQPKKAGGTISLAEFGYTLEVFVSCGGAPLPRPPPQ